MRFSSERLSKSALSSSFPGGSGDGPWVRNLRYIPEPPTMMGVFPWDWISVMMGAARFRYCWASKSWVGSRMPNRWCGAWDSSSADGAAVMVSSPR